MVNEKAIWLFAGGIMQASIAKKILKLGYKLIITDLNPECYCSALADELIECDTFDIKQNLEICNVIRNKYNIVGVVTVAADCHETVAIIAKSLELPGIDPRIANICRFKHKTREILFNAGIQQPNFKVVGTFAEAISYINQIGIPVVLKSTDNSGSRGFSLIQSLEQLTIEKFENALSNGTTKKVLIEECLLPINDEISEQSVETLWLNGKMYWLNWVDRLFRDDFKFFKSLDDGIYDKIGWGVELGHINPAVHSLSIKNNIEDQIRAAGNAIGMGKQKGGHFLKADIMLTKKGPVIIELTPRLSGGWDSGQSTPSRGADFIGAALQMSIGEEVNLEFWMKYFNYKYPNLYSSVITRIKENATDCIGRQFSTGNDFDIEQSLVKAINNLKKENYVIPME